MKQVDLAVAMGDGMSQSMISMIETGRLLPSLGRATQAAQALGVSLDWIAGLTDDPTAADRRDSRNDTVSFLTDLADGPDYTVVPWARDVRAAAGEPRPVFDEASGFGIAIHRSVLPGWARGGSLICISAAGDSMEPALRDGDLVALDYSRAEPIAGRVFVVRTGDGLLIKRLRGRPGAWTLASDNPRYRPRPVRAADRIIGRVAWSGPPRA